MSKKLRKIVKPRVRHFIKEWRKYKGLTQERLASRVELTPGAISQLEGGTVNYTQPTLEALAEALGCEPGDLLRPPPIDAENELAALVMAMNAERKAKALKLLKVLLDEDGKAA